MDSDGLCDLILLRQQKRTLIQTPLNPPHVQRDEALRPFQPLVSSI